MKKLTFLIVFTLFLTSCASSLAPESISAPADSSAITPLPVTTTYDPSDFIASEILGRPTDSSITINVVPAVNMEIYYEYGIVTGVYTAQTAIQTASTGIPVETIIPDLQPDTRYFYRLRYNSAAGPEHSFITQRLPGSTFTFDLIGDSHPERVKKQFNANLYVRTLTSVASDHPDFFFTIGDDFSVDTLKNVNLETVTQVYVDQRQWLGLIESPVFLVNGNHEQAALANYDGTPDNVAVWAQNARNAYYPQPAPDDFYTGDIEPLDHIDLLRDYYSFSWGDALFVVIDPYWHSSEPVDNTYNAGHSGKNNRDLWNITFGEEQYQWFCQTLESSNAKYKFVFAHHVNGTGRGGIEVADSFEWGDAEGLAAHRPEWDRTIHQVMVDTGVTIFFQGHDHLFARQELDGVTYVTLPSPADPNYASDNADAYLSGDILPASGHVRVTVSPNGVTVDYIRSYMDGPDELAFSFLVE
jgi:phosphodiesterase/alkaline phosphatase D-like protein